MTEIVAPVEAVNETVREDDGSPNVQRVLGAQERMRTGFQGHGHVKRILQGQGSVF